MNKRIVLFMAVALCIVHGATVCVAQQPPAPEVTDTVALTTSAGTIVIGLYGKDAPKTVQNYLSLVGRGYYDGINFHRVVPGFVIQAGDPQSRDTSRRDLWGTGGKSASDTEFADELNPGTPSYQLGYKEGTVAMANRGPNTNTSQFFIMLVDNDKRARPLQKNYTIFGRVIQGMDAVHSIEKGEIVSPLSGRPKNPIVIVTASRTGAGRIHN